VKEEDRDPVSHAPLGVAQPSSVEGATIHSIIAPLRIVLEEEVHAGRLAVNPAKGLRMPAADASATASRRPSRRFASWMRFGIVTARCGDGDLRGPALR
jgi:hypothetical protein